MELKNAVAVCVISLFSATLVVLIARSLDSQAAARLEPQLAQIAQELRALRAQGGVGPSARGEAAAEAGAELANGLVVYYFHSNTRCPTCEAIESQSHDVVHSSFAAPLKRGEMAWKVLNYEAPSGARLAGKFDVIMPVVVLARMHGGQIGDWKRLDEVWPLVGDKPAFAKFVRAEIDKMLAGQKSAAAAAPKGADSLPPVPPIPTPSPADLPVPGKK